jgi:hypothetical protein
MLQRTLSLADKGLLHLQWGMDRCWVVGLWVGIDLALLPVEFLSMKPGIRFYGVVTRSTGDTREQENAGKSRASANPGENTVGT